MCFFPPLKCIGTWCVCWLVLSDHGTPQRGFGVKSHANGKMTQWPFFLAFRLRTAEWFCCLSILLRVNNTIWFDLVHFCALKRLCITPSLGDKEISVLCERLSFGEVRHPSNPTASLPCLYGCVFGVIHRKWFMVLFQGKRLA